MDCEREIVLNVFREDAGKEYSVAVYVCVSFTEAQHIHQNLRMFTLRFHQIGARFMLVCASSRLYQEDYCSTELNYIKILIVYRDSSVLSIAMGNCLLHGNGKLKVK